MSFEGGQEVNDQRIPSDLISHEESRGCYENVTAGSPFMKAAVLVKRSVVLMLSLGFLILIKTPVSCSTAWWITCDKNYYQP